MAWFQNPFFADFYGNLSLEDRQLSPVFKCPINSGRSLTSVANWRPTEDGYDLSGTDSDDNNNNILKIRYAIDSNFLNWMTSEYDLTEDSELTYTIDSSNVKPYQIVDSLNKNDLFATFFKASFQNNKIVLEQKRSADRMKFYIMNGQAESVLGFNDRAGVAQLPSYFRRHTVFNRNSNGLLAFEDGNNMLVELSPSNSGGDSEVDDDVIENNQDEFGKSKNYNSSVTKADWELLVGKSTTFMFKSRSNVASASTVEEIVYPAGAEAGDFSIKNITELDGSGNVLREFSVPHTLEAGDLITPP